MCDLLQIKIRNHTSKNSLVFFVFQIRKKRNLAELTVVIKYLKQKIANHKHKK